MDDKMQQNQLPQNHSMGMNGWPQAWQNLQNSFAQARPYGYWPQWSAHYSMNNMTSGNGVVSHPSIPFQSMHVSSINFPSQINASNVANSSYNASSVLNNVTLPASLNNIGFVHSANKPNPPLPAENPNIQKNINVNDVKSFENPDKIPLPDGPPPSNKPNPPLPSPSTNSSANSQMSFYNSHSQPIKFNLNQTKSFTSFNLPNKKNRRKKNKNNSSLPYASLFNKAGVPVNFTPDKKVFNTSNPQNPVVPSQSNTTQKFDVKQTSQDNNTCLNTSCASDNTQPISIMQNSQPSHDDWPPSLLDYIKRCYLKCESSIDKDQVGIILKGKITSAMSSNTLFTKNWNAEPLPNLRGKKVEPLQRDNVTSNINVPSNRGKIKFNDLLKNRTGKIRNYRGTINKTMPNSPLRRNFKIKSKSRSTSRSDSRSRSRSRSRSGSRSRRRSGSRSNRESRSGSRSRSSSGSGSRSRSRSGSSINLKKKRRNSDSNSSNDNSKIIFKFRVDKKGSKKPKRKQKRPVAPFFSDISIGNSEGVSSERLQQRAARFKDTLEVSKSLKKAPIVVSSLSTLAYEDTDGDFDFNDLHIVGTCQALEKPFLRLTSAPDASQVRPIKILEKSLELIKAKWMETADYRYTCEQLKSIRQDLTVQGIRSDFTVKVYETHARICLEKGDPEEFNQCQTQLRMLYSDLGGENKLEFVAYRILYYIYTKNTLDLTIGMGSLRAEEKEDECVRHALQVADAWCMNNYHRFFCLYQRSPKMSSYLIDWFIERERKSALKTMIKAYRQSLPVVFVAEKLGFESVEKFLAFTSAFNLAYCDVERSKIDCKASMASLGNF